MNKYTEQITASVQVYPTATTGISSSALLDMQDYRNAIVRVACHRLPDAKGEGVVSVSFYESTASTWNGAVATLVTSSKTGASLTSVSDASFEVELRTAEMTVSDGKRYLGVYIANPTSSYSSAIVERTGPRYEKV